MTDNPADDREAVWSPDGLSLAFSSDRAAPGRTVYRLDASGKIKPLTDGGADENPDWVR
jgi:Tol biopolymer transport system component